MVCGAPAHYSQHRKPRMLDLSLTHPLQCFAERILRHIRRQLLSRLGVEEHEVFERIEGRLAAERCKTEHIAALCERSVARVEAF